jgi:hypothetical protein
MILVESGFVSFKIVLCVLPDYDLFCHKMDKFTSFQLLPSYRPLLLQLTQIIVPDPSERELLLFAIVSSLFHTDPPQVETELRRRRSVLIPLKNSSYPARFSFFLRTFCFFRFHLTVLSVPTIPLGKKMTVKI